MDELTISNKQNTTETRYDNLLRSTFRGFLLWIGASTKQQAQQFMISIPRRDVDRIDLRAECTDGNIHSCRYGTSHKIHGTGIFTGSMDGWIFMVHV